MNFPPDSAGLAAWNSITGIGAQWAGVDGNTTKGSVIIKSLFNTRNDLN